MGSNPNSAIECVALEMLIVMTNSKYCEAEDRMHIHETHGRIITRISKWNGFWRNSLSDCGHRIPLESTITAFYRSLIFISHILLCTYAPCRVKQRKLSFRKWRDWPIRRQHSKTLLKANTYPETISNAKSSVEIPWYNLGLQQNGVCGQVSNDSRKMKIIHTYMCLFFLKETLKLNFF